MNRSRLPLLATVLAMVFFYVPILILVANSFNASRYGGTWEGWTLHWYQALARDERIWRAVGNTLLVAFGATLTAMVLGTTAAFALHRYRSPLQRVHSGLIHMPLVVPDVLMGISLLLFFVAAGIGLSLFTVFLAHVTFCTSYVAMVVLARLQDFDFAVIEAAQDLGAGTWTIAWRILLPLLMPGIAAGGLLAFTLSIDDFAITFFVAGAGATTLPLHIYSMMKHSQQMPMINALSALLLTVTLVAAWGSQRLTRNPRNPR